MGSFATLTRIRPVSPNKALRLTVLLLGASPLASGVPRSRDGAERENKMFNNVTLIGHLGSNAETRTIRNDSTLTVLSLATKRSWKTRETGAWESQTTRHRCVFSGYRHWGRTNAGNLESDVGKRSGMAFLVPGRWVVIIVDTEIP